MDPIFMEQERMLIAQRQVELDRWSISSEIAKISAPPLPDKVFPNSSRGRFAHCSGGCFDLGCLEGPLHRYSTSSPPGNGNRGLPHLYLSRRGQGREVLPGQSARRGPRIKTEEEIAREYGGRAIDVAQPLSAVDGDELWSAARDLEMKQIPAELEKAGNLIDTTNYGGDSTTIRSVRKPPASP